MKTNLATCILISCVYTSAAAQNILQLADSIRKEYNIPELNYAVVSADSILEMEALGIKKAHTHWQADVHDKFRIGSNTKTFTSYIATVLINNGKLQWNTKFFDLYPELITGSDTAYRQVTLQELLTFRAPIPGWTYTFDSPTQKEIQGSNRQQRYAFIQWILRQAPVKEEKTIYWSNPAYVMAGMMLEKATGKDYETIISDLAMQLNITIEFGQPNYTNKKETWGHNKNGKPEKPADDRKLNWLSSAGNLNMSIADYARFIQMQLLGLAGRSSILNQKQFEQMHYGLPTFAYGWFCTLDGAGKPLASYHTGNPGTFLSKVYIDKHSGIGYLVFANIQSGSAEKGMDVLLQLLLAKYSR